MSIVEENKCTGCHTCKNICPKNCIEMVSKNGFLYPVIDESVCIKCGLCEKFCPERNPKLLEIKKKVPDAYGAYSKDSEILLQSSSGGIFSVLADFVLSQNGVVFGAGFDNENKVIHMSVDKKEDLHKLRQSKYVQSEIGDTFKEAKVLLENGIVVLFTGTPCQIVGLNKFLNKEYDNLLTQDIICHGAPSPEKFKAYISLKEQEQGASLKTVSFRNKDRNRWKGDVLMSFDNDIVYRKSFPRDAFVKKMIRNKEMRPSCYNCNYRGVNRHSDITLADFWGVQFVQPSMYNKLGTSLVIIHSEKGARVFNEINPYIVCKKVNLTRARIFNPSIRKK